VTTDKTTTVDRRYEKRKENTNNGFNITINHRSIEENNNYSTIQNTRIQDITDISRSTILTRSFGFPPIIVLTGQ